MRPWWGPGHDVIMTSIRHFYILRVEAPVEAGWGGLRCASRLPRAGPLDRQGQEEDIRNTRILEENDWGPLGRRGVIIHESRKRTFVEFAFWGARIRETFVKARVKMESVQDSGSPNFLPYSRGVAGEVKLIAAKSRKSIWLERIRHPMDGGWAKRRAWCWVWLFFTLPYWMWFEWDLNRVCVRTEWQWAIFIWHSTEEH